MKAHAILAATALLVTDLQTYRGRADAVSVDVLAFEGNRPIGGLTAADFDLRDNGVRQQIDDVTLQQVPFSMLLVLDTSASVRGSVLADLQDAARGAVGVLRPEDRASLITFSHLLTGTPDWTAASPALGAAIDRAAAAGMTSLYDAAFAALMHVDPEPGRRRLIVLFTDGDDTDSWLPVSAVLDAASRSEAVIYAVTTARGRATEGSVLMRRSGLRLTPSGAIVEPTPFLEELTARTGGELMAGLNSGRLRQTFERIVNEFRSRYVLTYVPANVAPAGWHSIDVKLVGRKGSVKARRGYQR